MLRSGLFLAGMLAFAAGSGLVGPGAMTPYSGGGGGRQRSYGYVREPAVGFFVGSSSIKDLNGLYGRVQSTPSAISHRFQLAYKEDRSGWILGLTAEPDPKDPEYKERWLLIDTSSDPDTPVARFAHDGNTILPGTGERWSHLVGGEGREGGADTEELEADLAELPWQIVGIMSEDMLNNLRRHRQQHDQEVRLSMAGHGLPMITAPGSFEQAPPDGEPEDDSDLLDQEAAAELAAAEGGSKPDYVAIAQLLQKYADRLSGEQAQKWKQAMIRVRASKAHRRAKNHLQAAIQAELATALFPRYLRALMETALCAMQDTGDTGDTVWEMHRQTLESAQNSVRTLEQVLRLDRKYPDLPHLIVKATVRVRRAEHAVKEAQVYKEVADGRTESCIAWRQTGGCRSDGPRESTSDKSCSSLIVPGETRVTRGVEDCKPFKCSDICDAAVQEQAAKCKEGDEQHCTAVPEAVTDQEGSPNSEVASRINAQWDHYAVLQVPHDFSREDLRRAYRTTSLAMHPDKHGGSDEAFQRVAEAHQILSSEEKKHAFDKGDDLKRERMRDGGDGPSVEEQLIKKYFPEEFDFQPFDASESNEHRNAVLQKQEERRANLAHQKAQELEGAGAEGDGEADEGDGEDEGEDNDDSDYEEDLSNRAEEELEEELEVDSDTY